MQDEILFQVLDDRIATITTLLKARGEDLDGSDKARISTLIRRELRYLKKDCQDLEGRRLRQQLIALAKAHVANLEHAEKLQFINDRLEIQQLPAIYYYDRWVENFPNRKRLEALVDGFFENLQEAEQVADWRNTCNNWTAPLHQVVQSEAGYIVKPEKRALD